MSEDKILSFIRQKGPCIPVWVAKNIGTNILFASAMMGELSSKGKLKISKVKIGGTPLYYIPGQESRLQQYSKYLHEKEQRAYELLKDEKILRDVQLDPVIRVTLRSIKDYAIPLEVSFNGGTEIFWKWFLLSKEEAHKKISDIITSHQQSSTQEQSQQNTQVKFENQKSNNDESNSSSNNQEKSQYNSTEQKISTTQERDVTVNSDKASESAGSGVSAGSGESTSSTVFTNISQSNNTDKTKKTEIKKNPKQKTLSAETDSKFSLDKIENIKNIEDEFLQQIYTYFKEKEIIIEKYNIIRKKSDIELTIKIHSTVGEIKYFVKAKNKKVNNDGDLSSAFLQGQRQNLAVMYFTTGSVTKKGKKMAKKDFPSMLIIEYSN